MIQTTSRAKVSSQTLELTDISIRLYSLTLLKNSHSMVGGSFWCFTRHNPREPSPFYLRDAQLTSMLPNGSPSPGRGSRFTCELSFMATKMREIMGIHGNPRVLFPRMINGQWWFITLKKAGHFFGGWHWGGSFL